MKKPIIIISILLILITGLFLYTKLDNSQKHFQVTFFNIGQGDAALIQFNDGKKMLVDCGPDRKILSKLGKALPFYDRKIDYLVSTHPDLDHYGGCADVLKRYEVKTIVINGKEKFDPYFKVWDRTMKNEGAEIKIMKAPEEWLIAGATLEFIAPDDLLAVDEEKAEGNNASIVFRLINGERKYLFTGDMEEPLEKALMQKYCSVSSTICPVLQADVLKVGHHGSDTSSGEDFLYLVNPKTAIISVGKNKYGHPSFRVMKKLERAGAEILRTDEKGDIILSVDNR
jgi:competence protein ComEC